VCASANGREFQCGTAGTSPANSALPAGLCIIRRRTPAWRMGLSLRNRNRIKKLAVPGGLLLLVVFLVLQAGWLTLPLPALTFLDYSGFFCGMFLAWRFHSSRIFLALLTLFLAQQAPLLLGPTRGAAGIAVLHALAVMLPLSLLAIAWMHERGFSITSMAPMGLGLFVEAILVMVLGRAAADAPTLPLRAHHLVALDVPLPLYAVVTLSACGLLLLGRALFTGKPADHALFWSLVSFFLTLHTAASPRSSIAYAATGGFILAAAIVENSYLLAYHDELTGLPSRRAFNDAILHLHHPYCIAVADIDHFKQFNDTYGHDTGDQVLRLVASQLAQVTGGGQAFRCGGEEFTFLFPGKSSAEVLEHLEARRRAVASAEFHQRSGERRQTPRGPDRRAARGRRPRTGHAIRKLSQASVAQLSVTISIGVASSSGEKSAPETILEAADRALYQAKANGRNRVEAAPNRRPRVKAAGIA